MMAWVYDGQSISLHIVGRVVVDIASDVHIRTLFDCFPVIFAGIPAADGNTTDCLIQISRYETHALDLENILDVLLG